MFGEECTLPMDIGLPKQQSDLPDSITSPYAIWVRDALEVAYDQVRQHSGQAVQRQKQLYDRRAVKRQFAVGDWVMRYYTPAKKCKLDSASEDHMVHSYTSPELLSGRAPPRKCSGSALDNLGVLSVMCQRKSVVDGA